MGPLGNLRAGHCGRNRRKTDRLLWGALRFSGNSRSDSLTIASLMNARGLMKLILLNIALKAGLVNQTLFTILVLMAAAFFNAARKFSANNC